MTAANNALCIAVFKMIVNELNLIPKDQGIPIFTWRLSKACNGQELVHLEPESRTVNQNGKQLKLQNEI